jgi:hypothetical protein
MFTFRTQILAFLLTTIIFALVLLKSNLVYSFANNLKLIPQTQNLTELYFDDYQKLPRSVSLGQSITFSFTIHNLENQDKDYPYLVYLNLDSNSRVIHRGVVHLKNGETRSLTQSVAFNSPLQFSKVIVELPDQNQNIHFLISIDS